MSQSFRDTLEVGSGVSADEFVKLLKGHQFDVRRFENWIVENGIDFLISPSTSHVAPLRGVHPDPDLNLVYTYVHIPVAYLPIWFDENAGLPFGLSLAGRRYTDYDVVAFAIQIQEMYGNNNGVNVS